ncbi:MAG TPA: 2-hydroxyacyl-CoA dehydratase family protein [bacterium]|jgi:benzoyl-CoA reductase subunit C
MSDTEVEYYPGGEVLPGSYRELSSWKEKNPGGKIIGCYPLYTPVELVHAAGILPATIAGAGQGIHYDHSRGSLEGFICSIGRSTLELNLDGALDSLDGIVFPSICEIARGHSGIWARQRPECPVFYFNFPQNLKSPHSREFLQTEFIRFREFLEEISSSKISDESINESIKMYNDIRKRIEVLNGRRCKSPAQYSASNLYSIRQIGLLKTPEEFASLLKQEVLKPLEEMKSEPAYRLMMIGAFCARPPMELLKTIENLGFAIVWDDLLLGQRWFESLIPTDGDPIENLTGHYLKNSVMSSVAHHAPDELEEFIRTEFGKNCADAILLSPAKFCHPAKADFTWIQRICKEQKIPYITIEYEENMSDFSMIESQFETFLEAREPSPLINSNSGGGN